MSGANRSPKRVKAGHHAGNGAGNGSGNDAGNGGGTRGVLGVVAVAAALLLAFVFVSSLHRLVHPSSNGGSSQRETPVGIRGVVQTRQADDESLPPASKWQAAPAVVEAREASASAVVPDKTTAAQNAVVNESKAKKQLIETNAFLATLPTSTDLRALGSAAAHETPELLLAAGTQVGALVERGENTPGLRAAALETLVACAEDTRLATAVRALCLSSATRYSIHWREFVPLADVRADDEIRSLAATDTVSDLK